MPRIRKIGDLDWRVSNEGVIAIRHFARGQSRFLRHPVTVFYMALKLDSEVVFENPDILAIDGLYFGPYPGLDNGWCFGYSENPGSSPELDTNLADCRSRIAKVVKSLCDVMPCTILEPSFEIQRHRQDYVKIELPSLPVPIGSPTNFMTAVCKKLNIEVAQWFKN